MRFVSVRDLRSRSAEIWRRLGDEGEIVVTSKGRPIAILTATSEATLEESLAAIRRARATAAVASLQRRSVAEGSSRTTLREINKQIRIVRQARRP